MIKKKKRITQQNLTTMTILETGITLNDEQIKALPSTQIQIIPAPGANKMILIFSAFVTSDARQGAYSNLENASGVLTYANTEVVSTAFAWGNYLSQTNNRYIFFFIPEAYTGSGFLEGFTI